MICMQCNKHQVHHSGRQGSLSKICTSEATILNSVKIQMLTSTMYRFSIIIYIFRTHCKMTLKIHRYFWLVLTAKKWIARSVTSIKYIILEGTRVPFKNICLWSYDIKHSEYSNAHEQDISLQYDHLHFQNTL